MGSLALIGLHFATESFPTLSALVMPSCSVSILMSAEGETGCKQFSTFVTPMSLLQSMNSLMHNKTSFVDIGFPTFTAHKRFFSSVDSLVIKQPYFEDERFTTFATPIRLFSTMDPLVSKKVISVQEALPTLTALMRILSSVDFFMLDK